MSVKSSTTIQRDLSVKVGHRGSQRLVAGHVWVYRSDILSADGIPPGALVSVFDERGKFLGSALYSSSSQIALRLLSREHVDDLPGLLRDRIRFAIAYREKLVQDTDAYRVVFSEGDFLPGLIVDRYSDLLSVQILTQAMDSDMARNAGLERLQDRKPDFVQMVDGDCELDPGWIDAALAAFVDQPDLAVVFGRRRERFPDRSIYNRLCDEEWNVPVGEARSGST